MISPDIFVILDHWIKNYNIITIYIFYNSGVIRELCISKIQNCFGFSFFHGSDFFFLGSSSSDFLFLGSSSAGFSFICSSGSDFSFIGSFGSGFSFIGSFDFSFSFIGSFVILSYFSFGILSCFSFDILPCFSFGIKFSLLGIPISESCIRILIKYGIPCNYTCLNIRCISDFFGCFNINTNLAKSSS